MEKHYHLPSLNRLSTVVAFILLAYATTAFVTIPVQSLEIQLPGFLLEIKVSFITVVAVIGAVLAGAGSDWLISSHSHLAKQLRWHHWIVPAFTAMAIGVPLATVPVSPSWWIIFGLGGGLLIGVLVSEYIVVDPEDTRYAFATIALTAVSFALFLILLIAITGAELRLYSLLAAIFPTVFLITIRTLFLRLRGHWKAGWAIGIALVVSQLAAGLFYLPIVPIQFSLVILGISYGLIVLVSNIEEKRQIQQAWIEPVIMMLLFSVLGFMLG